jgi:hypothetical protein
MGDLKKTRGVEGNFEHWLGLQREMQIALEDRLRDELGDEPSFLARYRRSYDRHFPAWAGHSMSPEQLTDRILGSGLALLGDYHSLAQSQRTALRLLKRLVRRGGNPALALEMIPGKEQPALDAFLSGEMSSEQFALHAHVREFWDFPWKPVQILLDFCRYHSLPVIGINLLGGNPARSLAQRDSSAAKLIAAFRKAKPDLDLLVLVGDYHLAASHLPRALARALAKAGVEGPPPLRIFQNYEPRYWESLAALGTSPEILALVGGDFCIQSATPLIKAQSYVHWLNFHRLGDAGRGPINEADPEDCREDLCHEVDAAARRIARFTRIPTVEQSPPHIYWIGAGDFARRIAGEADWSPEELARVQTALGQGDDCYLPGRDLGIFAQLSQNRIAEMGAMVLHGRSARIQERPRSLLDDFYLRVLSQAVIFLGSKLINPLRRSLDRHALLRSLRESEVGIGNWQERAELLLAYLEAEELCIQTGATDGFELRFFDLSGPAHISLTRAVGHHLGLRLYEALLADRIDSLLVRDLFCEPYRLEGSPPRRYHDLLEILGPSQMLRVVGKEAERL